ncbi:MAG: bifunctional phosphopantothenoylcysteine decarboxylase/phosphopantothenate--cysteine ligase CoaBC [Caldisericum exile]
MENKVLLAVTGGVAAYKSLEVLRLLVKKGIKVKVVITRGGEKFVTPFSFLSLGAEEVYTDNDQFSVINGSSIHLVLSRWADLIVVVPATADFISKVASGISDSLLLTTLLASRKPTLIAPSMNENMLLHPATQKNIEILKTFGYKILEPDEGFLADLEKGKGRLKEPDEIFEEILVELSPKKLQGLKVLVTSGSTREYIDPVRFITNGSSGKMGIAFAKVARRLGADVTLIVAHTSQKLPFGMKIVRVDTTEDLYNAVGNEVRNCDLFVMAAAPSDYKPKESKPNKLPKFNNLTLELIATVDVLREASKYKDNKIFVGFALQTDNLIENAKKKLEEKNLDYIVANLPENIGSDTGKILLIDRAGSISEFEGDKESIAEFVFSKIFKF